MYKEKYNKALELFFDNPTDKFYIREIARKLKMHPNTVIECVEFLEKEGLLKTEKKKHIVEVSANFESGDFLRKKRCYNLMKIYSSGIIEFLEKEFEPISISVIGSYARGEDIEKSDIDFVIISNKQSSKTDFSKFEKFFERKIHLIITNYEKMSDEFFNNLINGILLYGHLSKK